MGKKVKVTMISSPPVRPPCATVHSCLGGALATSYHLLLGQAPPSPSPHSPPRTPPSEEQPSTAVPPMPTPKQSPRLKRQLPLPEPMGNTPLGRATPAAALGRPPYPKKQENPPWFKSLKPSHAEAFLRDSNIVVEARSHFSPNTLTTLIRMATVISLKSLGSWLRLLAY